MENHHFWWENPLLLVIFNSYVKLPEGKNLRNIILVIRLKNTAYDWRWTCRHVLFPVKGTAAFFGDETNSKWHSNVIMRDLSRLVILGIPLGQRHCTTCFVLFWSIKSSNCTIWIPKWVSTSHSSLPRHIFSVKFSASSSKKPSSLCDTGPYPYGSIIGSPGVCWRSPNIPHLYPSLLTHWCCLEMGSSERPCYQKGNLK